ncbi:hypothetical protein FWC31_01725 [Candidatus Saccharibacteria bacterium]|nr:hypothetical protein [Candidatus Saccharibacteria bacterium]
MSEKISSYSDLRTPRSLELIRKNVMNPRLYDCLRCELPQCAEQPCKPKLDSWNYLNCCETYPCGFLPVDFLDENGEFDIQKLRDGVESGEIVIEERRPDEEFYEIAKYYPRPAGKNDDPTMLAEPYSSGLKSSSGNKCTWLTPTGCKKDLENRPLEGAMNQCCDVSGDDLFPINLERYIAHADLRWLPFQEELKKIIFDYNLDRHIEAENRKRFQDAMAEVVTRYGSKFTQLSDEQKKTIIQEYMSDSAKVDRMFSTSKKKVLQCAFEQMQFELEL